MPIDLDEAMKAYVDETKSKADKLVKRYQKKTGKADAIKSDDAQKAFEDAMADATVLARRQAMLKDVTETELNEAMEKTGKSAYINKTAAKSGKWKKHFSPFASEIDTTVAKLPKHVRGARDNIMNRSLVLAEALEAKKKELAGVK